CARSSARSPKPKSRPPVESGPNDGHRCMEVHAMMVAATAKAIAAALGMVLVEGTVLAVLAIVVARSTRSPAWRAAVWLVVLAKFAIPWGPSLPWSLADLIAAMRGGDGGVVIAVGPAAAQGTAEGAGPSIAWIVLLAVWFAGTAIVLGRAIAA